MDNEEHHPHVVRVGTTNYKGDYYTNDDELSLSYKELAPGCSCLFAVVCLSIFITCIAFGISFYKSIDEDIFKPEKCTEISYLRQNYYQCGEIIRLQKIEAAKDAKRREEEIKDSIARQERYTYLHDSILTAIHIQDSIDNELSKQQRIKANYIAFIDDGITSREVTVNTLTDTLSPEDMAILGNSFSKLVFTAVRERQHEIDNDKEYYTKRINNEDQ